MSADASDCPACGAHATLEYAPEIGTLACTRCGTVSSSSASHSFELLQRVDAEDAFQNGRTYVGGHAGAYGAVGAGAARRAGARVGTWTRTAEGGAGIYQAQRRTEAELYIRRLLTRYDLHSALRDRTRHMFDRAKARLGFRWGRKAEIFAAACVYVAAREAGKPVWLLELAALIDVKDPIVLTRAVRVVKHELKIPFEDHDPAMFIERLLVRLQTVFAHTSSSASSSKAPPLPPLHGSADKRKTTFTAPNAAWVRSLALPSVRDLATGLLALTSDLSLTAGRRAESVACAVVIAALEGVARRPAPVVQEFADELAWTLGVAGYTVMERYRDINRLLVDFAARLPWLVGGTGAGAHDDEVTSRGKPDKRRKKKDEGAAPSRARRKDVKTEVVAFTADIVAMRETLITAKPPTPLEPGPKHDEGDSRTGTLGDEDEYDKSEYIDDPLVDQSVADRYYGALADDDRADNSDRSPSPLYPPQAYGSSSPPPVKPAPTPAAPPVPAPAAAPPGGKAAKKKRPAQYTRDGGPMRAQVGGSSPATGTRGSPSPSLAAPATDAHVRQLLLAGLDLDQATRHVRGLASTSVPTSGAPSGSTAEPTTRLGRLLWAKPADEITDAELFDDGELEAYLRPKDEAQRLLRLPWAKEMIALDEAHTRAREARPDGQRARTTPAATRHGYRFSAPRDPSGNFVGAAAGAPGGAVRVKRGATEDTDDVDGFRPRQKRTKITNRAALEAYLAQGAAGSDDDEEGAGQGRSGEGTGDKVGWKVEMALQAAQDEGEDVVEGEDDEGDEDGLAREGGGGDDDWRKEFAGYRAVGDDDDGDEAY